MNHTVNEMSLDMNATENLFMSLSRSLSSVSASVSSESTESNLNYLEENKNVSNINDSRYDSTNKTLAEANLKEALERFILNRSVDDPWYSILISLYSVLIIFGALGNTLVIVAVIRKPSMRTPRNLFILNLAVSDLLLCLVTMPLTLMEIISKHWPFGSCAILCQIIGMLQATSIFVSTISITAIALDRYQVIVYPSRNNLQFLGAIGILIGIWILALLLASPMFIYKRLVTEDMPTLLQERSLLSVHFCIEEWPFSHGRFYYSIFSLCVQYVLPIMIVSSAYFGIYNKLKNRINTVTTTQDSQRKAERGRRIRRTNCLLISITVIFGVSWLPLNFFNLYADLQHSGMTQSMLIFYAICHMTGMSSACSNPLLYGYLNENFRKEFHELLCHFRESANVTLNDQTTGCSCVDSGTSRKQKDKENSRGNTKILGDGNVTSSCGDSKQSSNVRLYRQRSSVTKSAVLTENPMSTEVMTLMSG